MGYAAFHIVYVDKRVSKDLDGKFLPAEESKAQDHSARSKGEGQSPGFLESISSETDVTKENLKRILSAFHGVYICTSSDSCLAKLSELESDLNMLQPTLVVLELAFALDQQQPDAPSSQQSLSQPEKAYPPINQLTASRLHLDQDLRFLEQLSAQISRSQLSPLVLPIALVRAQGGRSASSGPYESSNPPKPIPPGNLIRHEQLLKCLDAGAVDVFASPLSVNCMHNIIARAYRAGKDVSKAQETLLAARKSRKRSWVGFEDRRPYAYLREEMVSGLMNGICAPEPCLELNQSSLEDLDRDEKSSLIRAFTSWGFSAHDFSEDQLVHSAFLMLQHALNMPELERWRLPAADLKSFLLASRAAYNSFVHYHNFRHVVDVMQAVFYFLLHMGTLPPFPNSTPLLTTPVPALTKFDSPIERLLKPFDALTLLISAIGHDVGHPGVNNAFLVALNAPLAQLYNDKSVLESFHCAAYSQILRRHWKAAFEDNAMRSLMINSILATDMGVHFKYMADLGDFQSKAHHNKGIDGWGPKTLDELRTLTCGLLIKCADISNVARPFDIAAKWADILQLEFANQGVMEQDVGIPTTLFGGPPELGNLIKLANSQNGFMSIFACPLFEAVSDVFPSMAFAVDEMKKNQEKWKKKIAEQNSKDDKNTYSSKNFISPRSGSPSRSSSQPELSHPEGLPASEVSSRILTTMGTSNLQESRENHHTSTSAIPSELQDPVHIHKNESRRSSLGNQHGRTTTFAESTPFSRRSSGTYPAASTMYQSQTIRRSSNTSPSQIQLGLNTESRAQGYAPVPAVENVQPGRRHSDDTLSQTNASAVTSETGSRNVSIGGGGGGGSGVITHRGSKGSKSSDGEQMLGQQRSLPFPTARYPPYHERHSSGGHTSRSQSVPYSPTETQATSVTEDSDEKGLQVRDWCGASTVSRGLPETVNVEKPGSGQRLMGKRSTDGLKSVDVKTAVVNGNLRAQHSNGDRLVTRKSSRFLNFWKKRGKAMETSP